MKWLKMKYWVEKQRNRTSLIWRENAIKVERRRRDKVNYETKCRWADCTTVEVKREGEFTWRKRRPFGCSCSVRAQQRRSTAARRQTPENLQNKLMDYSFFLLWNYKIYKIVHVIQEVQKQNWINTGSDFVKFLRSFSVPPDSLLPLFNKTVRKSLLLCYSIFGH